MWTCLWVEVAPSSTPPLSSPLHPSSDYIAFKGNKLFLLNWLDAHCNYGVTLMHATPSGIILFNVLMVLTLSPSFPLQSSTVEPMPLSVLDLSSQHIPVQLRSQLDFFFFFSCGAAAANKTWMKLNFHHPTASRSSQIALFAQWANPLLFMSRSLQWERTLHPSTH